MDLVLADHQLGLAVPLEPGRGRRTDEVPKDFVGDAALDDDAGEVGLGCVYLWTPPLVVGTVNPLSPLSFHEKVSNQMTNEQTR